MAENPSARIRVFHPPPSPSDFTDFQLLQGETIIGCDLPGRNRSKRSKYFTINIPFSSSSLLKEHCRILIDDNEHFIMGLGTKGKTQRRGHTLRPNVYYELVDGIHLTLGDLKCQYYYSTTITREEEGEKEEKEVETGPDLNKTLPVDSDSTVTPSPRSAQLIPISPPTLPSFDNDAELNGTTECGSPQLLTDPPALASEPDLTLPYNITSSPHENKGSGEDEEIKDDETLPFNSQDAADAGDRKEAETMEDTLPYDADPAMCEATLAYNLEEEKEEEESNDDTKPLTKPTDTATGGSIASLLLSDNDDDDDKCLLEPTVAYDLEEPPTAASEEPPPMETASVASSESIGATAKRGRLKRGQSKKTLSSEEQSTPEPPSSTLEEPPTSTLEEPPTSQLEEPPTSKLEEPPTSKLEEPPSEEPLTSDSPPVKSKLTRSRRQPRGAKKTKKIDTEEQEMLSEEPPTSTLEEPPTSKLEEPPTSKLEAPPTSKLEEPPTSKLEEPPTSKLEEPSSEEPLTSDSPPVKSKLTRSRRQPRATKKTKKIDTEEQEIVSEEPPTSTLEEPPMSTIEEPPSGEPLTSDPPPVKSKLTRSRRQPRGAAKKTKKIDTEEQEIVSEESPTSTLEETPSEKQLSKRLRRQPAGGKKVKKETEALKDEFEDPLGQSTCDTIKSGGSQKPVIELEKLKTRKETKIPSLAETPSLPSLSVIKRAKSTRSTPKRTQQKTAGNSDSSPPPCILFTGLMDEGAEDIVKDLGGRLVDSVSECTHCVTDKVRRTVKFLCCLAKGCHIVSIKWLGDCNKEGKFLPVDPYIIKDSTAEKQYQFSLRDSITAARRNSLLSGWRVFLTEGIKPSPPDMTQIIDSAGGEVIKTLPSEATDNTFVVSCEKDDKLLKSVSQLGIPICTSEVILTGILQQRLELDKYRLSIGSSSSSAGSAATKKATKRRRQ